AARLTQVVSKAICPNGRTNFEIVAEPTNSPLVAPVPADRAVCAECLNEIGQINDRRHQYSFTSCTHCGPRYTVIRCMPFERDDTVMKQFPLCPSCHGEYTHASDRRFHAQTTTCPTCGPRISFELTGRIQSDPEEALRAAARELKAG